jgi:hypothetical protein
VKKRFGEQTFEGRRENLSQANKLSRTYAVLLQAADRVAERINELLGEAAPAADVVPLRAAQ